MKAVSETGAESVRQVEVQWGDLDSAGIVYYPHFFSWADAAGHQLFRAAELPMDRLLADRRIAFGLVSAGADFQSPARYADRLFFRSTVSKLGTRSIELTHRISREDGSAVATLRETRVCMDLSEPGRIRALEIPEDVSSRLRRFEARAGASRPE